MAYRFDLFFLNFRPFLQLIGPLNEIVVGLDLLLQLLQAVGNKRRRLAVCQITAAQRSEKGKPPGNQCHNNCFGHGVYSSCWLSGHSSAPRRAVYRLRVFAISSSRTRASCWARALRCSSTIWTRASQMAQSSEMVCMLLIGSGPPLV